MESGVSSLGKIQALALLRRTYRGAPAATRAHVLGRFLSCPFLRVLAHLPPAASLLDLGAGHGIFAHLALAAGARSALAVEPDGRKVFHMGHRPALRVVNGYHAAVRGRFEAVTIFDVLYRLPREEWDPLLAWARARLAPGGVFLLKEIDPGHRAKALWNRAQERGADLLGGGDRRRLPPCPRALHRAHANASPVGRPSCSPGREPWVGAAHARKRGVGTATFPRVDTLG